METIEKMKNKWWKYIFNYFFSPVRYLKLILWNKFIWRKENIPATQSDH